MIASDTAPGPRGAPRTDGDAATRFVVALEAALMEAVADDPDRRTLVQRCLSGLDPDPGAGPAETTRPPACRHFDEAAARAVRTDAAGADDAVGAAVPGRASPGAVAAVARALAALEPSLAWYRRGGDDAAFRAGHANAFIAGAGALDGARAALGITLMAPGVSYPAHRHAPEELYLVLSPGRWRHGGSGWFEPGIGGTVHNVPGIVHAMCSDAAPLLAIWCLAPVPGVADRSGGADAPGRSAGASGAGATLAGTRSPRPTRPLLRCNVIRRDGPFGRC